MVGGGGGGAIRGGKVLFPPRRMSARPLCEPGCMQHEQGHLPTPQNLHTHYAVMRYTPTSM